MNPGTNKPQTLAEWLDAATGDLVPSAQARVRAEIEAHYAEAVQGYLKNGQAETEARTCALADLGDARRAALRFRREYLTRPEIACLAAPHGWWLNLFYIVAFCVNATMCALILFRPRNSRLPDTAWAILAFLILALPMAALCNGRTMARGTGTVAALRRKYRVGLVTAANLYTTLALVIYFGSYSDGYNTFSSFAILLASLAVYVWCWLNTWQKLWRVADGDLPPADSISG